jgi:hypothetical protein
MLANKSCLINKTVKDGVPWVQLKSAQCGQQQAAVKQFKLNRINWR